MSTLCKTMEGSSAVYTRGTISLRVVPRFAVSRSRIPPAWVRAQCARLQQARKAAGYSQPTMAEALNLENKTYAKYETRTPLPQHLIGTVCRLLDLDPLVFLDGYGRDAKPGPKLKRVK